MINKTFFLLSILYVLDISAQQNYEWLKIKKYKVATLSDELKETSGLKFAGEKLYSFNDGGNTSEIFELDKSTGNIINKLNTGLTNTDWEALTSDESHFYIGDFGNNWGIRKDLKIYKVPQSSPTHPATAETISFQYPEQKEFIGKPHNNNWDAESLVYKDGKLHIFTKEWQSYQTAHYRLNSTSSEEIQNAEKLETYNLGYLATDASYFKNKLYIIGYTRKMEVFLTVFKEDRDGKFFTQKPQKYYLGQTSKLGQIEGIAVNDDGMYISGEAFKFKIFNAKPSFYFIPKEKLPWVLL